MHGDASEPAGAASGLIATSPTSADVLDAQLDHDADGAALIEEELLVEEISIDGMCGVY